MEPFPANSSPMPLAHAAAAAGSNVEAMASAQGHCVEVPSMPSVCVRKPCGGAAKAAFEVKDSAIDASAHAAPRATTCFSHWPRLCASRKMLNMMEWWLCLVMPKEEVEQIARFKDLNDEQRNLLLSARKEPGKYVEGVVLADKVEALFRNVPPALSLALAMTEKHEKAERAAIMREKNCSELEAVYEIARRIEQSR